MNNKYKDVVKERRLGADVRQQPTVSVIIPAYNIAEFVVETLESVYSQTYQDFEVILVNDGSPDTPELEKLLEPYFSRLIYIRQTNSGASVARNYGILAASGKYLAFLDGDDVWLPENLSKQVEFLENSDFEMVYCDAYLFGEIHYKEKTYMEKSPSNGPVTPETLLLGQCNVITSGTCAVTRRVLEVGFFDVNLPRNQDFDLWFRLAKHGVKIGYQREVLLKYRVRLNSLSGTNTQRAERNVVALKRISEKYELTPTEQEAWDFQMGLSVAELELEKGKYHLLREEFDESLIHFRKSNDYYKKKKLSVIIFLIGICPRLLVYLFRKIRSEEISFIAPEHTERT
jgi:glycosyltransferase involved in cell wall biosynthesis